MDPAEATRKRAKPLGGGGGGGEADMLSALPNCLLHVIMSSLKARQAVQTCVLSRRWRHLWRSVPCLDVDLGEFRAETPAEPVELSFDDDSSDSDLDILDFSPSSSDDDDDSARDEEWERFEDFAANLMVKCNIARLESFRLNIGRRGTRRTIAAGWLRRAMKYCTPDPVAVSLRSGSSSHSWFLKRLHLCYLHLDNRFAEHVSSTCRSLEDLELHDCSCAIQLVASHTLKNLVLKNCRWCNLSEITSPTLQTLVIDGGSNTKGCMLVITAPAVTYLHLAVRVCRFRGGISTNETPSITKASIHLEGHRDSTSSSKLVGDQLELLSSVSNVTSLQLWGVGTTVLGKEPRFQEFMNLRNLMLGYCDLSDDFRTLGFFLQSSPNLEKVTLRFCKFPKYFSKKKKGMHILNKSSSSEFHGLDFVCENLKVEIIYKDGNARQLIKLLLQASGNLSKSHIKLIKI